MPINFKNSNFFLRLITLIYVTNLHITKYVFTKYRIVKIIENFACLVAP